MQNIIRLIMPINTTTTTTVPWGYDPGLGLGLYLGLVPAELLPHITTTPQNQRPLCKHLELTVTKVQNNAQPMWPLFYF